jgi:hypothetical protein
MLRLAAVLRARVGYLKDGEMPLVENQRPILLLQASLHPFREGSVVKVVEKAEKRQDPAS